MAAANYDRNRAGFQWRTLEDTTNDPTAAHRAGLPYRSWQMSEEYYSGGQMMWLEADARIRALSDDGKSLDDFAKAFFGVDNGSYVTKTYTFDDVVAALNGVVKDDWAGFLHARVDAVDPPLLNGIEAPAGSWSTPTSRASTRSSTTAARNHPGTCTTSPGPSA